MQPSIISPVPIITFDDDSCRITAVYHSQYGAPLEDAQVGVITPNTTIAATSTTVSGETFTGIVSLQDITTADSTWSLGDDLTILARTKEQDEWSETRYTAKTCGNPTVTIVSGGTSIPSFPAEITWSYDDYDGFFQNKFELTLHTSLMGDVVIAEYTSRHSVRLNGEEIAYGAAIGGTEQSVNAELVVYSTSGLSKTIDLTLVLTPNTTSIVTSASLNEGRLVVDAEENPFFLYVLYGGKCEQCAYTESGYLDFLLPISGARYFAITLNDSRIGHGNELDVDIDLNAGYLDYSDNGVLKRLDNMLNPSEDHSLSNDVTYTYFAGRTNPVVYFRESEKTLSAAFEVFDADIYSIVESLRNIEGVYRSAKSGSIHRVAIDSVDVTVLTGRANVYELDLGMTVIDGSPYKLFYDSPFFQNAQLYPGEDTYPSSTTWTVA